MHLLDAATFLLSSGPGPIQQRVSVQLRVVQRPLQYEIAVDFVENEGPEGDVSPPVPRAGLLLNTNGNAFLEDDGLDALLTLLPFVALAAAHKTTGRGKQVEGLVSMLLETELHHPLIGGVNVVA